MTESQTEIVVGVDIDMGKVLRMENTRIFLANLTKMG